MRIYFIYEKTFPSNPTRPEPWRRIRNSVYVKIIHAFISFMSHLWEESFDMSIFRRVLLILSISTVTSLSTQTGPKKGNRKGIRPSRQPDFPPDVYVNPTQDSEENVFLSLLFGNLLGVSRESRLLKGRSYARKEVFESDNLSTLVMVYDSSF